MGSGSTPKALDGVERTARILRALEALGTAPLAEIARAVSLSDATVLRYLNSLIAVGFVERDGLLRYRLGWELLRLARSLIDTQLPQSETVPVMTGLRDQFNETVNLAIRKGKDVMIVEVVHSTRAVRQVSHVGQIDPWHSSALGKALLAHMSEADRNDILNDLPLDRYTSKTIVDRGVLNAELQSTAERGYAVDDEENAEDLICVAAAIPTRSGMPDMALSASFIAHRIESVGIAEVGRVVREAADNLGARLSH